MSGQGEKYTSPKTQKNADDNAIRKIINKPVGRDVPDDFKFFCEVYLLGFSPGIEKDSGVSDFFHSIC